MSNTPLDKIVIVVRAVFGFGDKYLVVEQENASGNSYLLFPGGHANCNESLIAALKREIAEETNIDNFTPQKIIFVKETFTPFDRNFEYFFQCETNIKFADIKIKQTEYTGYEKIKKYLLLSASELDADSRFFPKHFFGESNYQYLELNLDRYKQLYGNDRNIKNLNL